MDARDSLPRSRFPASRTQWRASARRAHAVSAVFALIYSGAPVKLVFSAYSVRTRRMVCREVDFRLLGLSGRASARRALVVSAVFALICSGAPVKLVFGAYSARTRRMVCREVDFRLLGLSGRASVRRALAVCAVFALTCLHPLMEQSLGLIEMSDSRLPLHILDKVSFAVAFCIDGYEHDCRVFPYISHHMGRACVPTERIAISEFSRIFSLLCVYSSFNDYMDLLAFMSMRYVPMSKSREGTLQCIILTFFVELKMLYF
jgi:hypothetical protein